MNPDQYKTLFTEAVLQLVEVIGVSSAVQRPKPPVFVSLPPMSSTWESLTLIIPIVSRVPCIQLTQINRLDFSTKLNYLQVLTYGIIGYPFIMPGPVGGDYYNDAQLANYTYMYIKSVENALLHKSINSFINKSKTEHESKATTTEKVQEEPKAKEEKALTETQLEEDFESEELTSEIPKEPEKKEEPPEQQEPENVFSTNYDNFFNKNINPSMAADIVKNISATTKTNILEKASEAFPGILLPF